MTGAECLLRKLLNNNIDLCLMNPGTSEMQFVSALDRVPAMRGVLCLHETVCAGAADGYARMAASMLAGGFSACDRAAPAKPPGVHPSSRGYLCKRTAKPAAKRCGSRFAPG